MYGIHHWILIEDPTVRTLGFNLTQSLLTVFNRIRTEHGKCNYLLHKWGMVESPLCSCQEQTIRHKVEECPITKFTGGIKKIHTASVWIPSNGWITLGVHLWSSLYQMKRIINYQIVTKLFFTLISSLVLVFYH